MIPSWLEISRGDSPILLIAPHGGRAGAAARATLHPKVNDLETAAITRELAARLDATALINAGMDRNELDCNRLSQLVEREPWLLAMIADEIARIAERHTHAIILLVHGWNIIEPRIDLGLGVKEIRGRLRPPRGAFVSAGNEFIHDRAAPLADRLRAAGIVPTFGLRYPGAGAQNLLQAFTPRHASSGDPALRCLATLAAQGKTSALQLELAVALRLPGAPREAALAAITETFNGPPDGTGQRATIEVLRESLPVGAKMPLEKAAVVPPFRIGIEFYDPAERLGGMASFDFGPQAAGGRIMMLFERRRVALFTGEGGAIRDGDSVSLGPLTLDGAPRQGGLHFHGPAVVVDEGSAYLSVEGALASGRLDPAMMIDATLAFDPPAPPLGHLLADLEERIERAHGPEILAGAVPLHPSFGRLRGTARLGGVLRRLDAIARVGVSFTGLGPQRFVERRMLWACTRDGRDHKAVELRALTRDDAPSHSVAHVLRAGVWHESELRDVELDTASPHDPPERISASANSPHGAISVSGSADTFMTLSRPGPDGARIHTSLGFALYSINGAEGAGMYEYSRRVAAVSPSDEPDED